MARGERVNLSRLLCQLAVGAALIAGCTDAKLESVPNPPKPPLDDKLRVEGNFCTEDPMSVEFPVKVLFVVDTSDSMSVTDPPNPLDNNYTGRTRAVIDVINELSGRQGVAIGMITFNSSINDLTHGFVTDYTPADVIALTNAALSLQSNAAQTNYEGALDAAFQVLVNDMRNTDEKARSRSKYVVIFVSDGMPNPVTEDPPANTDDRILTRVRDIWKLESEQQLRELKLHTVYLAGQTPPQYQQVPVALLKNMADEGHGTFRNIGNGERINFITVDFTSFRRVFILKSFYVANRNTRPGYEQATDSDGDGLSDDYERLIGTDPTKADTDGDGFSDLLEDRLRNAGFDPLDPGDADCAVTPTDDYNRRDEDGDGLRNCEERFLGTSPRVFDTDADGIPDGLEVLFGLNPVADDATLDLDHDGAPNGVEVRAHFDPTVNDVGNLSVYGYRYDLEETEIRVRTRRLSVLGGTFITAGVQPGDTLVVSGDGTARGPSRDGTYTVAQVDSETDVEVTTDLPGDKVEDASVDITAADGTARQALSGTTVQSITASQYCYKFSVDNITLASTLAPAGGEEGWNQIFVSIGEVPQDAPLDFGEFRIGCVRARFVQHLDLKTPGDGIMRIPEEGFKRSSNPDNPNDPEVFDPARDCIAPSG
jgi:uncharacterized protein YegL